MSAHRFQWTGVDLQDLQMLVEATASISAVSLPLYIDVTLTNDAMLPDLQTMMTDFGWSFVSSSPTTPLPTISSAEYEIDFGPDPVPDAKFTLTVPEALPTSRVSAVQSGKTATGRTPGDAQWDALVFGADPSTGSIILYATCPTGSVAGKRIVVVTVDNLL